MTTAALTIFIPLSMFLIVFGVFLIINRMQP